MLQPAWSNANASLEADRTSHEHEPARYRPLPELSEVQNQLRRIRHPREDSEEGYTSPTAGRRRQGIPDAGEKQQNFHAAASY